MSQPNESIKTLSHASALHCGVYVQYILDAFFRQKRAGEAYKGSLLGTLHAKAIFPHFP
jgi:hypothetical protein